MGRGWAIGLAAVVLCASLFGYLDFLLRQLPAPGENDVLAGSITVYDRNGQLLGERNSKGEYHVVLSLGQMGRYGPAATLAAEDRSFYAHGPIDPVAIVRAAATDVLHGGYVEGGSTITQQLVKIQLLTSEKSIDRKIQEAALAWALEHRYSKDQILEMYLNRVYYGHGAYGLGAATKTYFGSAAQARDLTPAQAAFLAGLIQAPTGNDPATHFDRARARQLYVLNAMVETGAITRQQEQQAEAEPIQGELKYDTSYRQELAPHFVDYVIGELEDRFGAAAVQQGGFRVYTTLDAGLQALADKAVADGVSELSGKGVNNGTLLAARPSTGEILAWVGSADYASDPIGGQFDVVLSPRQPGSSFKPYVYAAALRDHKVTLCTVLQDSPTDFGGYKPLDFDNRFMGPITTRRALLLSRNVPAVEVAQKEGISNVIDLAHAMGIRSKLEPSLPTAIGASDVSMYDQVQGYQVLANQGEKVPLMAITRVVDRGGNTVYEQQPGRQDGQERVLPAAVTYLVADVLKAYPAQWGLGWKRELAGKSGTSGGSQIGVHPDSWMMAYNPNLVIGAWAGNTAANGAGKTTSAFGTDVGSSISAEFINGLPASVSAWYQRPDGVVQGRGGELMLSGTDSQQSGCSPTRSGEGEGGGEDQGGQPAPGPAPGGPPKKH